MSSFNIISGNILLMLWESIKCCFIFIVGFTLHSNRSPHILQKASLSARFRVKLFHSAAFTLMLSPERWFSRHFWYSQGWSLDICLFKFQTPELDWIFKTMLHIMHIAVFWTGSSMKKSRIDRDDFFSPGTK